MNTLIGLTAGDWFKLLRQNRFAIDPPYWRRSAALTIMGFLNSAHRRKADRLYGEAVADVEVKAPLFILGHWRSGTTLLHTLMALDGQFVYPNLFQVSNPHTFLYREKIVAKRLAEADPEKRPMDNMRVTAQSPGEDESAIAVISLRSPNLGWLFPRRAEYYDRFLTFRETLQDDVARWKEAVLSFFRKVTWKYRRPLLLKSPTHTCRIRLLLELFPDARFVHIHRDPYTVFRSTQRLYEKMMPSTSLQHPQMGNLNRDILRRYNKMYDAFFEERDLIPEGQFFEVCFEELEKDKVGQVAQIYEHLNLPGFQVLESALQRHLESIADYKKGEYAPLPELLRRQVAQACERSFEEWGYAT